MPQLVIACARPGLIRGGVRHPKTATHLLTTFSFDQLREMLAEPELALVIGHPLTNADIATMEAEADRLAAERRARFVADIAERTADAESLAAKREARAVADTLVETYHIADAAPETEPEAGVRDDQRTPAKRQRGRGIGGT